jgi:hypothetical protein
LLGRRPSYLACGDGDGCGFLDRLRPGGVLPGLLVGADEALGLGAGDERLADVDGDGAGEVVDPGADAPPGVPGACRPDARWPARP